MLLGLSFRIDATFGQQLIPYLKGDKWSFCTMDKKIVIPCVYDGVYSFREGLARVQKNGKWFYINREGVAYYED